MTDTLSQNNERCGTTHTLRGLSASSAAVAIVLMITTIPLNGVIIYCLLKERQKKFKAMFYKIIVNIAFADLLMGIVGDTTWLNFLILESRQEKIEKIDTYFNHISLFLSGSVALIATIFLSIERITAIVAPVRHYKGIKNELERIIIFLTWPLGILLVFPYFKVSYIRQLFVFTVTNVAVAITFLAITVVVYNRSATLSIEPTQVIRSPQYHLTHELKQQCRIDGVDKNKRDSKEIKLDSVFLKKNLKSTTRQTFTINSNQRECMKAEVKQNFKHRATRTFMITLVVFLAAYIPMCFTMVILNFCIKCDCTIINIMRDWSSISIRLSSTLRPITFIYTLRHIRISVFNLLGKVQ